MKKVFIACILILTILCSCQKTPENSVVVQKNDGIIKNAIKESEYTNDNKSNEGIIDEEKSIPMNFDYSYPNIWQAQYSKYKNKFNMVIDADVIVTHNSYYPIVTIKPYYIPIEQVDIFVMSIFGSLNVPLATTELTKDEIMDVIIQAKADIKKAENSKDKEKQKELENILVSLYEEYEKAPETAERKYYESKYLIKKDEYYERHYIDLRKNPGDKQSPIIQVHNDVENLRSTGFNSEMIYEDSYRDVFGYNDDNLDRIISIEHSIFKTEQAQSAITLAEDFLKTLGIDNRVLETIIPRVAFENSKDIIGYALIYGKKFNDIIIPQNVQLGGTKAVTGYEDNEDYVQRFNYEYLQIEIENNEIVEFFWEYPFEIKETIVEDIELLPFEEIMNNVENQLSVKYAYLEEGDIKYSLYIDKIILTYAVERMKDNMNEFMLIPVWAFYGGYDYGEGQKTSDGRVLEGKYIEQASLLTINALDGSVIFGR